MLKIAADKAYDKAWVEAFFRMDSAGGPDEEAPEPSPTTGNPDAGSALADEGG